MTTPVQSFVQVRAGAPSWGASKEALEAYTQEKVALNKAALENWHDPAWHRQVAADLESVVDYGFSYESMFGNYFNIEQVGEFDRVIVRERRGMEVFFTSRGGYIEETQFTSEQWEMPRDTFGFHVSEHIDKLRANFADTIEDLVSHGQARMEAEVYRRAISLMQAAVPSTSPYYRSTAGLLLADVNAAITRIADIVQPDGVGPVPITIMGRRTMIDQLMTLAAAAGGFDPELFAEIRLRGQLGTYRGANVVYLRHYVDARGASYVPGNELWIFGGNVGKFALFGGTQVKQWDEHTVDYRHYRARRDLGGLVHHPEFSERLVDTSLPA